MENTIQLRPFKSSDAQRLASIANNANISDNLRDGFPHPYTLEHASQFISRTLSADPISIFAIEKDGEHVGNIGLHPESDIYSRTAELGYFVGEDYWGKGIGTEAVRQIVQYGFETMNLIRIHAGVFEYNRGSMRILEKNGFLKEGVSRKRVVKNGKVLDEHQYSIINPKYA